MKSTERCGIKLDMIRIVIAICILPLLTIACNNDGNDSEEPRLIIATYGGDWQEVQQKTMFQPYSTESGVVIEDVEYDGFYETLLTQAESGDMNWDIVAVEKNMISLGEGDGIIEAIDYSIVDSTNITSEAIHPYGVGTMAWSWVLAYNSEMFSENPPMSWADFFDVENFPGSRGLRDDPRRILEIALLADGVNKAELYPLDVERALSKLDNFIDDLNENGHQVAWWNQYAEPLTLLEDVTVVMTPATNGRIFIAKQENDLPIEFTWEEGIVDFDWWIVTRDTSLRDEAMEFINYASSVEAQSQMATEIHYGPVNTLAIESLPNSVKQELPTNPPNLEKQLFFDNEWWAENHDDVHERWSEWFSKY